MSKPLTISTKETDNLVELNIVDTDGETFMLYLDKEIYEQYKPLIHKCLIFHKEKTGIVRPRISFMLHHASLGFPDLNGNVVDHINRNVFDNRKDNLRICTRQQNMYNSKRRKDSQYQGVYLKPSTRFPDKPYVASVSSTKGNVYVGRFETEADAAKAYDIANMARYGQYAFLNFPENRDQYINQLKNGINIIHIERDPSDYIDIPANLNTFQRSALRSRLAALNRPKSSSFRGVCWDKQRNKWKANIKHLGKKIHIGLFETEADAAKAYDKKATELHGLSAKLNFS